ncbi:MAG: GMP synthase [Acidimicrobiia bacterium]|nr:MAG: GMP synthase [Acidimicrobiia bacterium]
MRIGLLQCDYVLDRYRSIAGDYHNMIEAMLDHRPADFVVFDVRGGELPEHPRACEAYIISGSSASVYEDERWIRGLESFVVAATEAKVPIFGICFGLQAMATAFGGTVERSESGWGVGVHTMRVGDRRSWMDPGNDTIGLIMIHQDQIVALPEPATVLGSSDHCANFLVEFTPTCVGIQGHPEFPAPYARALYEDRRERLGDLAGPAIESLATSTDADVVTDWIYAMFASPTVADS